MAGPGSTRVILTALAANVGIAIAKFIAGGLTGSSAMITEGVHSLVDSANHVLLLHGTRRSQKGPDAKHPLGYGRELYFWSFVVAILVFSLGAGVSLYEGVLHLLHPEPTSDPAVAFIVLGVAAGLEGWSTWEALRAFRADNGSVSLFRALQLTKDAPTLVVLLENSAAIAGLAIAAAGIGLAVWTGNPLWDGTASVLIGLVLAVTAVFLIIEAKGLLIGESADPELVEAIRACAVAHDGVEAVYDVLTVHHAPEMVVSVISVDFVDTIFARDVERIVSDIEQAVSAQFPVVARVFVRPVQSSG